MDNPAQFDRAALAIVRPGIDGGLTELRGQLERFWSDPSGQVFAIQSVQREARRLSGVFSMVGLEGLAVYCAEIETVLAELASHPDLAGPVQRDGINASLDALVQYLDDIAQGADNATLRLFGKYQQLQFMRGLEASFELDMFFPGLQVQLPGSVLDIEQVENPSAQLKAARNQYQQALLRYLRQLDADAALHLMQQAMLSVMSTFPANQGRAYWWVAAGFFDCLAVQHEPMGINVSRLLGRIDQQMRMQLEGKPTEELPELYQMLYLIARTEMVFDGVPTAIKQTYSLQRFIETNTSIAPSMLSKRLSVIAEHLKRAQESWDACVSGKLADCVNFKGQVGLIEQYCDKLDPGTLQVLARAIAKYTQFSGEPENIQALALDMAMALLLLERGLESYFQIDASFQDQALLLSERMHAAIDKDAAKEHPLTELVNLYCDQESTVVRAILSKEMLGNLQHIEDTLSAFFEDPAKRSGLSELGHDIEQIQGGLHMLNIASAAALSDVFQQTLLRLSQQDQPCDRAESRAIANALSELERYLTHLSHPTQEMEAALSAASHRLDELNRGKSLGGESPSTLTPRYKVEPAAISSEDFELIEIFLEEADEVLAIMRENLELCHLQASSIEPLITIRRGFHTLKGSGRMVGLNELSEVAWALERAMNTWLKNEKPVSTTLKKMVGMAIPKFSTWVDRLRRHGSAIIDAAELLVLAEHIERGADDEAVDSDKVANDEELLEPIAEQSGVEAKSPSAPRLTLVQAAETTASHEAQVQIGAVVLSGSLFKIGSEESQLHVQTLQEQLEILRAASTPHIEFEFMRAAHTLAGVNRAMGFNAIVELAFALESWLQARMDQPFLLKSSQLELLQNTISTLTRMVQNLCARQFPKASGDMVYLLNMDRDKLHVVQAEEMSAPASQAVEVPVASAEVSVAVPVVEIRQQKAPVVIDEVDEQLLPVFLEEADDLAPKIGASLRAWRDTPADGSQVQLLNRLLHTLKGSARMAGAMRIGQVAHEMEDAVLKAEKRRHENAYWDELDHEFDRIMALLEELHSGEVPQLVDVADMRQRATDHVGTESQPDRRTLDVGAERALQGNMLRVRADVIDRLVNEASEISVARARMEGELRAFKDGLLELTESVVRLRKQLREVEIQAESQMQARVSLIQDSEQQFDPLEFDRFTRLQELTRFMNESVHDVQTVQQALLKNLDETTAAMSAQARLNRELQQSLMNVRMVPFNSVTDRLYRIVRQTGKELNKRANLELSGTSVELDRSVLEKMTAPFEHLLRNAMAHGLENEEQRNRLGKQPIGEIRLALRQENNEVVFELSDDGAGLDFPTLREKAIAQGALHADESSSEEQLAQLIFTSGISTASKITEVAGRGIGMDVVRSEITALGGRIDVASHGGQGTRFTIHLPLTLAVTQVLMVRCGEAVYALPAVMVEQVRQVKAAQMEALYAAGQLDYQGKIYPLHYLPQLLGVGEKLPETLARNSVLLLRSGEARMALHIDELLGNHEAVVKNIGPQLARMPGIAGATVRGNGAVVLILNPLQISQSLFNGTGDKPVSTELVRRLPLVMVVDDSLTVRKITTRMLTRAGYEVITAKDGVDALEQLNDVTPAVMLLDVEMPRMDGFELTKRLRQDSKTKQLPIIMITSRTADKHRDHALQLGVNAYLGKPYQEDELLEHIATFVTAA
jgi:chemosensory pili system protein ChpA (sensor histidine kinase/response regulator)